MHNESADVDGPVGPVDGRLVPRFSGPATFARLPSVTEFPDADVVVLGVPFDTGVSYRPGARFGPQAIRAGSRLLRAYNPALGVQPFADQQVVDAGDVVCNPFDIIQSIEAIDRAASEFVARGARVVALGGDHTIALPLLRSVSRVHGPVALLHFDAHLDTWDTYFGADYTHGTPFRRAAEEGCFVPGASMHVGIRGPLYTPNDISDDERLGFGIVRSDDLDERGAVAIIELLRERVGSLPLYVSIDIDVLDPAFAPGTGTPEPGGVSSRELLRLLRGLSALDVVGGDIVEVAPPYDHAEITAIAGAGVAYELISVMATTASGRRPPTDQSTVKG